MHDPTALMRAALAALQRAIASDASARASASAASTSSSPAHRPPVTPCHDCFNDRRNTTKVQSALEKRLDCDLVGGVQAGAAASRRRAPPPAPAQAAERLGVGRAEIEPPGPHQIEEFYTGGMRSGQASAWAIGVRMSGAGQLRQHRAVDVLDQRMHDALRMHHDLDVARVSRTASRPRSAPAPCSSGSPSRPRSCVP